MRLIIFFRDSENELNLFSEEIRKIDDEAKQIIVPMISARIEAINNKKPKEIIDEKIEAIGLLMEKEEYLGPKIHPVIIQL